MSTSSHRKLEMEVEKPKNLSTNSPAEAPSISDLQKGLK